MVLVKCVAAVTFCLYSFLFLDLSFLFCDYSSLPCHRPADYTCLHNRFLPSASSDFCDSSLLTHTYVLLCDSITFCHVPFALSSFQNFPSLRYINSQLAMYFPKLDLLCTLVHCHTNLVNFSFSRP